MLEHRSGLAMLNAYDHLVFFLPPKIAAHQSMDDNGNLRRFHASDVVLDICTFQHVHYTPVCVHIRPIHTSVNIYLYYK